ncbi:MAG: hypothetical protein U1F42_11000, partial [Candidatus Competibacteraceae bacterium]
MKIASSTTQLFSQHSAVTKQDVKESLRMWTGDRRPDFEGRGRSASQERPRVDTVHLSQAAREAQPSKKTASADTEIPTSDDLKLNLLVSAIELLTGKKIKLVSPKELNEQLQAAQEQTQETTAALQDAQSTGQTSTAPQRVGFGIEYDYYERHYEAEKTTFAAEGAIKTQDGQEIQFSMDLSMSREFLSEQSVNVRAGDAKLKDPLVLNFNGNAAELTSTRFSFDIDSDGRLDQIAFVGPKSGFLALDRNNDGVVNDGRELFGATTGQG